MKRLFGVLVLLACGVAAVRAQRVLSIDSCRQLAMAHNKSLLMAKERIHKAHYERKAAFTNFLPDFSATGGYAYFSDEISLLSGDQKAALGGMGSSLGQGLAQQATAFVQQVAQSDPQLAASLQQALQGGGLAGLTTALDQMGQNLVDALRTDTRNLWVGAVNVAQPLYMGGKIRAYNRIARHAEALARSQHDAQLQEVVFDTDNAYWTVVSLAYKKRMAEGYRDLVVRLDSDVEKMIAEGVATKADGLTVKVKVNEAEMLLTKVDNGLALARMVLCQQCGLPLDTSFALADEQCAEWPLSEPTAGGEAVERALANRPELRSLDFATRIYDEKVKVERSGMLPSLALTGGYMVSNPSLLNGFEKKFHGLWNVGVMLSVPVFHWNEGIYKVRAAKSEARIARLQQSEAQEKIELQVNQGLFRADEARKRVAMSAKNMEKAEENLRYARKGFQEGVIPVANVMEAQTAWLSALSDKIDAQIDLQLAEAYLLKAMGVLDATARAAKES